MYPRGKWFDIILSSLISNLLPWDLRSIRTLTFTLIKTNSIHFKVSTETVKKGTSWTNPDYITQFWKSTTQSEQCHCVYKQQGQQQRSKLRSYDCASQYCHFSQHSHSTSANVYGIHCVICQHGIKKRKEKPMNLLQMHKKFGADSRKSP